MPDLHDQRDTGAFLALRFGEPVFLRPDACLIVRRPGAECGLCREACPKAVLGGGEWSVALETDGCIGCGLCAAACPTGAILVEGFAAPAREEAVAQAIECARVPEHLRRAGAEVVPCLGGLSVPDLLERAAAGGSVIVDRGLCETCEAGCGAEPWAAALAEARALCAKLEQPADALLTVDTGPVEPAQARPMLEALRPDLHATTRPSRRDLFRRVLAPPPEETPVERSRRIIEGRGLIPALRRKRELASLGALAEADHQALPATVFPAIHLAEGCGLHGVCAAICPTGALSLDHAQGEMTLSFDAETCISCAECQRACPTRALSFWPDGDGSVPQGRQILSVRQSRSCAGCGSTFPLAEGETERIYCLICEKSVGLMQALSSWRAGCP